MCQAIFSAEVPWGGDGLNTQLNISDDGFERNRFLQVDFGVEVNVSGGFLAIYNLVETGNEGGGNVGAGFSALSGSEVNVFGSDFVLDGVPLDDSLTINNAFTILDRDVTLSGLLADGSAFSFDLNSIFSSVNPSDPFELDATLTVTLVADGLSGDVNLDGVVNFSDIPAFITVLSSGGFQAEADTDLSGMVDFGDIPSFIRILSGQ